jgi:peptidyl-prolyl cis-trans isomerase A (cyclophilin A)
MKRKPFSRKPVLAASALLAPIAAALIAILLAACPAERRPDEEPTAPPQQTETPEAERQAPPEQPSAPEERAPEAAEAPLGPPRVTARELVPGDANLYGILRTSMGAIVVRFFEQEAPVAVANFVGLATGQLRYRNAQTGEVERGPFYDGTIFHRVIPDFMIQGGDPTGTGTGGPGYRFNDERQDIGFDRPGLLGMANAGPNTNGSQFFITERPTPHLTGRHTIFGTVEQGMDIVNAIARVPRGMMDRPMEPVVMENVEIVRSATPPTP